MTAPYSVLHFLVDGICAYAMFGRFSAIENWHINVLYYNFCAFALQMPLGVVLDGLNQRRKRQRCTPSFVFAVLGVFLTCIGAWTHPLVLGLGNALFHLGGGVGTIFEDERRQWHGRGLGVFVAPGALGLYLGTQLAKSGMSGGPGWLIGAFIVAVMGIVWCMKGLGKDVVDTPKSVEWTWGKESLLMAGGCLLVVTLRSYIGMAVGFPWKSNFFAGTLAVFAVVFGKVAGGFAAAKAGVGRMVVVSLLLSSLCYLFSENMLMGVCALFLFNMTMPITLYLLVRRFRGLEGFSFGLLTFGLFVGFLPVYLGVSISLDGPIIGCVGSLLSFGILWFCTRLGCWKGAMNGNGKLFDKDV